MRARTAAIAAALRLLLATGVAASAQDSGPVRAMIRRVLESPEAISRVTLARSDPFGGPPTLERGRVWYQPGRGLRYRSLEKGGQDVVIDRRQDAFLVYSPREGVLYRGAYGRAPDRLRRLIAEPERALAGDLAPSAERREVPGGARDGYRIGAGPLSESDRKVSLWIAADPRTGLPRWVSLASEADTLWVEFHEWRFEAKPRERDLSIGAPKGTREEPLDPRELLERAGPGRRRESR